MGALGSIGEFHGWSMLPLTVDDLLPLEEYVARRKEFFDAHRRYVDRYRRIRIGPKLTLIFENRQTLWFRVQEVMRIARLASDPEVQAELNLYNRLLPSRNLFQAALLIEIDSAKFGSEMSSWNTLAGNQLALHVGTSVTPARLVTSRPEDRAIGTAHWVQFIIGPDVRKQFANFNLRTYFRFENETYQHSSPLLGDEFRQNLIDDLVLSDRDNEKRAG
ncbi:MAG: DUF3501 family protein [Gemmataceae bacterium]|nr:DUF3501 family protein [Gemmataceae bacterium]